MHSARCRASQGSLISTPPSVQKRNTAKLKKGARYWKDATWWWSYSLSGF